MYYLCLSSVLFLFFSSWLWWYSLISMIMMNGIACGVYDMIYIMMWSHQVVYQRWQWGDSSLLCHLQAPLQVRWHFLLLKKLSGFSSQKIGERTYLLKRGLFQIRLFSILFLLLKNWMFCFLSRMRAGHVWQSICLFCPMEHIYEAIGLIRIFMKTW